MKTLPAGLKQVPQNLIETAINIIPTLEQANLRITRYYSQIEEIYMAGMGKLKKPVIILETQYKDYFTKQPKQLKLFEIDQYIPEKHPTYTLEGLDDLDSERVKLGAIKNIPYIFLVLDEWEDTDEYNLNILEGYRQRWRHW